MSLSTREVVYLALRAAPSRWKTPLLVMLGSLLGAAAGATLAPLFTQPGTAPAPLEQPAPPLPPAEGGCPPGPEEEVELAPLVHRARPSPAPPMPPPDPFANRL